VGVKEQDGGELGGGDVGVGWNGVGVEFGERRWGYVAKRNRFPSERRASEDWVLLNGLKLVHIEKLRIVRRLHLFVEFLVPNKLDSCHSITTMMTTTPSFAALFT
jgi:hypothetical protein